VRRPVSLRINTHDCLIALSLTDIITPANLAPVFASKTLLQTLYPFLPTDLPAEQPPSEATIRRVIESPQFQTGVRSLDQALSTGLLGDFVTSLGLPAEAGLGVEPFLKAIIEQAKTDRSEEQMETD
jgi:26S proteasome regulatory subunit N13